MGDVIVLLIGVNLAWAGTHVLRNLAQHCDEALHEGTLAAPHWRTRAWARLLYTTSGAGLLVAGTLVFGLALVDLIF